MISKKVKDIVNSYLQTPVVEEDFVSIEDLDEGLMEDLNDDIDIDFIIDDIANFYNESDEETQAVLDEMLEEEDGIENIVSVIYEEDDEDEEEEIEEEEITELSKDVLARYTKKAAVNIRTKSNIHHGYEDIKADITKVMLKHSPNVDPYSNHDRDPDTLKQSSKEHEVISNMIKLNQHKQNNRIEGIGRAVVNLAKAKAPASKNPGPTIDQKTKLGLAKTKISATKTTDPKASAPGPTVDQPSKTGNEKPTVSTTKTTKH